VQKGRQSIKLRAYKLAQTWNRAAEKERNHGTNYVWQKLAKTRYIYTISENKLVHVPNKITLPRQEVVNTRKEKEDN